VISVIIIGSLTLTIYIRAALRRLHLRTKQTTILLTLLGKLSDTFTCMLMTLSISVNFQSKGTAAYSISFRKWIYIISRLNSLTAEFAKKRIYFMLKNKFTCHSETKINALSIRILCEEKCWNNYKYTPSTKVELSKNMPKTHKYAWTYSAYLS
jgi:hypothetical protein